EQQLQLQLQTPNTAAFYAAQYGFTMEEIEQQTPSYSKEVRLLLNLASSQNFKVVYDRMVAEQENRDRQFPTVKKTAQRRQSSNEHMAAAAAANRQVLRPVQLQQPANGLLPVRLHHP
ncbi:hypothetical protein PFISCL1PPCAC_8517, partial [Pristionchus fissidentatus]